jgi:FlgD Ig-like domain
LQRVLTTAILVGLLIATSVAFVVTERLKLEKSPITSTLLFPKYGISPVCRCATSHVTVRVRLRRADAVTVTILDDHKDAVRLLVIGERRPRGFNTFRWDGRTGTGERAPDGTYHAEIHLARQHQTIVLPNPIVVDTVRPRVTKASVSRAVFSPDGDGRADSIRVHYTLSKQAHAFLYLDGRKLVGPTLFHREKGDLPWQGTVDGQALPAGTYRLEVRATDLAGNATPVAGRVAVEVEIRYIALDSNRITGVRHGKRFGLRVSTDAVRYSWQLGARHGTSRRHDLVLLAPALRGRYTLTVREHGHVARAAVIVR